MVLEKEHASRWGRRKREEFRLRQIRSSREVNGRSTQKARQYDERV